MDKTIAIDFDGVISKYDGWRGKGVFGLAIPGVVEAINKLKALGFTIIINTTRLEVHQIKGYLLHHNIPYDYVNYNPENTKQDLHPSKVLADIYIDDRAITFDGDWDSMVGKVCNFKVWWRK